MPHYLSDEELKRTSPPTSPRSARRCPRRSSRTASTTRCRRPRTAPGRRVDQGTRRRTRPASRGGPAQVPAVGVRHRGRVPGDEQGVRPGVRGLRPRPADRTWPTSGQAPLRAVHLRRPDPLRARRLRQGRPARPGASTPPSTGTRSWPTPADVGPLQVRELPQGDLLDSDTKVALLSGAPFDDPSWYLLSNDQIATPAGPSTNRRRRRMFAHSVVHARPGRLDGGSRPRDSRLTSRIRWKGYTIGDPLSRRSKDPLAARRREAGVSVLREGGKSGINNRLHPQGAAAARLRAVLARGVAVRHGLGRAQGLQGQAGVHLRHLPRRAAAVPGDCPTRSSEFEKTGEIRWVTDLAEIPAKYGVNNVYGELGTTFATSAVTQPALRCGGRRHAGQRAGRRPRGLGHRFGVVRLTAMADRGHAPARDSRRHAEEARLRAARRARTGAVKSTIFAGNSAQLYKVNLQLAQGAITTDKIAAIKAEYVAMGGMRSNARYGYVHRAAG